MITRILLIRHGDSSPMVSVDRERGLTEQGHETVRRMTEELRDVSIDAVVSSPYVRALMTVQGIADERGLSVATFEDLRERQLYGSDALLPSDAFYHAVRRSFDDHDVVLEGGESFREAQLRAVPVIRDMVSVYRGRTVAVGTHGNIMTMILHAFDERFGWEFWRQLTMPDVYAMTFEGDELQGVERLWSPSIGR
ncbi:histidine phosphatase family protein [Paenibacillus sp. R14(2021)]|uniref:histidine phosphatase family protein n=1 Tax=Paenibacillus sp. R14(2021) TaxID=2859228 RepID=UPI001C612A2B|nr:histidine phosphatase family protein [Paenibacillus sp. R14(2021)]